MNIIFNLLLLIFSLHQSNKEVKTYTKQIIESKKNLMFEYQVSIIIEKVENSVISKLQFNLTNRSDTTFYWPIILNDESDFNIKHNTLIKDSVLIFNNFDRIRMTNKYMGRFYYLGMLPDTTLAIEPKKMVTIIYQDTFLNSEKNLNLDYSYHLYLIDSVILSKSKRKKNGIIDVNTKTFFCNTSLRVRYNVKNRKIKILEFKDRMKNIPYFHLYLK